MRHGRINARKEFGILTGRRHRRPELDNWVRPLVEFLYATGWRVSGALLADVGACGPRRRDHLPGRL
jgi:hypothetical protein